MSATALTAVILLVLFLAGIAVGIVLVVVMATRRSGQPREQEWPADEDEADPDEDEADPDEPGPDAGQPPRWPFRGGG